MALLFQKLPRSLVVPSQGQNTVFLIEDNWDDFGFKTIFFIKVFDENGTFHDLGTVKIGYRGQNEGWTSAQLPNQFSSLSEGFFSLGQEPDYYLKVAEDFSKDFANQFLLAIKDVVENPTCLSIAEQDVISQTSVGNDSVFNKSILRSISSSVIKDQFPRILAGGRPLTDFEFSYEKKANAKYSGIKADFSVDPNVKPSTNIHVLIGRNGVGKTTLLNNMVDALLPNRGEPAETGLFLKNGLMGKQALDDNYFSSVVSVSFSAFDPFTPPAPQTNPNQGTCYYYIGLKTINQPIYNNEDRLKSTPELCNELIASLKVCLALSGKRERWINAVRKLESDTNFADMNLCSLVAIADQDNTEDRSHLGSIAQSVFSRLSSGHAIVLLTLTKLVETVDDKTLVLIDEPESHLHPPLLSAFTRALSDLLLNRNGVAIIATHSPVVLQEVPQTCVSILRRTRLVGCVERPTIETFGENVGVLTREIFGLEVNKSGFYSLLADSVREGKSYAQILSEYQHQLGFEGKAILRAICANTENGGAI
ncbi:MULTISPECIES: AAA family ATPase [Vibrio]|uniref:AAA family ATPase n=1 Tax=Vibrio TaxID=662 RepID=UPI000EFC3245|nr:MULTISPECIES: AAA family ATPase [Vibrio]MDN3628640.1 AAA family ATPase [Vibrio lentus]